MDEATNETLFKELLERFSAAGEPHDQAMLVQLLRDIQALYGFIPAEKLPRVAEALGLKRTFLDALMRRYPSLKTAPEQHTITVCLGPRCTPKGGRALLEAFEDRLGVKAGETTADGRFRLAVRICMKRCGQGPNLEIDGTLYPGATPGQVDAILARY